MNEEKNKEKKGFDTSKYLSSLNDSRLTFLFDPLKRLQALELALIIGLVICVICAFMQWWIAFAIFSLNELVIIYNYWKERKNYLASGGFL